MNIITTKIILLVGLFMYSMDHFMHGESLIGIAILGAVALGALLPMQIIFLVGLFMYSMDCFMHGESLIGIAILGVFALGGWLYYRGLKRIIEISEVDGYITED